MLGLDEGGELLDLARQRWAGWVASDGRLGVVDDFVGLRGWLPSVGREESDAVLLALAMLGSPTGGDDIAAAGALAKCLMPGACVEADRLGRMLARGQIARRQNGPVGGLVEGLVASQLWIEVRTFPWRRLTRVAANILVRTRVGVLRELGDNAQLWRSDRTWANTAVHPALTPGDLDARDAGTAPVRGVGAVRLAGFGLAAPGPGEAEPGRSPLEELLEVLAWACEHQVITWEDRWLLLVLVEEAARVQTTRVRRGRGGLVGNQLSAWVAPRIGVSASTVRRRASKSMAALAAAVPGRYADDA
jgi:hypothetical protein